MKRSATDDWEETYLKFCADNQHLVPAILERVRSQFGKKERDNENQPSRP